MNARELAAIRARNNRPAMPFNRAREINGAMIDFALASEGIYEEKGHEARKILQGCRLREMLTAAEIISAHPDRRNANGSRTIFMSCDPRLVASIYTFLNYSPHDDDGDNIIKRFHHHDGSVTALILLKRSAKEVDTHDAEQDAA